MKSKEEVEKKYISLINSKTGDMYVMDAAITLGMIKALTWVLE